MFDTLDGILSDALARLQDGAANPGSPWRTMGLATAGLDATPRVRTVVLRRFDQPTRALDVHTDTRSAKHAELQANRAATLHGWDPAARVQLRASGHTSLHTTDDVADAAWANLRPESRATYRVMPGPGTTLSAPDMAGQADEAGARSVFCAVRLTLARLEWLHLGQGSHRRARFTWEEGGRQAMWLVP